MQYLPSDSFPKESVNVRCHTSVVGVHLRRRRRRHAAQGNLQRRNYYLGTPFFHFPITHFHKNSSSPPIINNLLFLFVKNAGLETGMNRYKTETEKNWKPVLTSKPKPKRIEYRYYN